MFILILLGGPVDNLELVGGDYDVSNTSTAEECHTLCLKDSYCFSWTFIKANNTCLLKDLLPTTEVSSDCCVSGLKGK